MILSDEEIKMDNKLCHICLILSETLSYDRLDLCDKCYKKVNNKIERK